MIFSFEKQPINYIYQANKLAVGPARCIIGLYQVSVARYEISLSVAELQMRLFRRNTTCLASGRVAIEI